MGYKRHLYDTFGYTAFRNQQDVIIENIVDNKRDVLAIIATSGGKSLCYQLPAVITGKPAIVISPLISLMTDQKINLEKCGVAACCYNSTLPNKIQTRKEILNKDYLVIYITPETITSDGTLSLLKELEAKHGLSVIAIDEAHCVSLWGQSFRDSYLQLHWLGQWLPNVPILALTGTATQRSRSI